MEIPLQYYMEEFKQEAVKLVIESGLSIAESGSRLNIPAMTLKNWIYRNKNSKYGNGKVSGSSISEIEAENSLLRKELAESRLECEIIKKAMVLCEGVAARYATIKRLRLEYYYPVSTMLKIFSVSRGGYYTWLRRRPQSDRKSH